MMHDVVIVGGGLCGLALAHRLQAQGRGFMLFEARERLGGRIHTVVCPERDVALDLGPGWFWPQTQPLMAGLVAALGLKDFAQADGDEILLLHDPDKAPERRAAGPVHGGARRVEGGMARLVEALSGALPSTQVRCGHVLLGVRDHGDHVRLDFRHGEEVEEVVARCVVLAAPPRLVAERIEFMPPLDPGLHAAMQAAATWMATRAKLAVSYASPAWRAGGQSGNAFVAHGQAVLAEIFDASAPGGGAALGGFLALDPDLREAFSTGLPLLMESQMMQVFGPALGEGRQYYQDWAREPFTCAAADRAAGPATEAEFANPRLRRPIWGGRLHLGGAETGAQAAGYMEGALEAARRISRTLAHTGTARLDALPEDNEASLEHFAAWVAQQGEPAVQTYRRRLNRGLALQQREQLTQRALLGTVEEVYGNALAFMETLPFTARDVAVERGRSALTPRVQAPFGPFLKGLVEDVTAFNRTSCALSNFPDEHELPADYMQTILRDIAAAWSEFSLAANALLLAK